jgi:3-deoxy-D-manno-octulosonic-acid transferase
MILYNLFLTLAFPFFLPRAIKKHKNSWKERLGLKLPKCGPVDIWIHAISMGETKAAAALIKELRAENPKLKIALSALTETGFAEGVRSIKDLSAHFYMPIDFPLVSWLLARRLRPKQFILVESDFWLNLLTFLRDRGTHISLVNGKVSTRSFKRYRFFKILFQQIDLFCVQTKVYAERFAKLGVNKKRIHVTGNLKLDMPLGDSTFSVEGDRPFITIASTHEGEEALLLSWLKNLPARFFLAPRHPERFDKVAALLDKMKISYARYSKMDEMKGDEKVILIDTMGQVMRCFRSSKLAIVGGSYVNIGGHNLFEPLSVGVPVFYGPYMHAQEQLAQIAQDEGVGAEAAGSALINRLQNYLGNEEKLTSAKEKSLKLCEELSGSAKRCTKLLNSG